MTFGVAPITLAATGGASGNPVTFSVISGPGSVTNNSLTITGAGTVVVAANQAGNINYTAAAQVTRQVVVDKATLAFTLTPSANPSLVYTPLTLRSNASSAAGRLPEPSLLATDPPCWGP